MNGDARMDLVSVGELLLLVLLDDGPGTNARARLGLAGAEFNCLAAASALGLRTALISRLGDDLAGRRVRRLSVACGVSDRWIESAPGERTGVQLREVSATDSRLLVNYRDRSAASRTNADLVAIALAAARPRAVILSGVTAALGDPPRSALAAAAAWSRKNGALLAVDANLRSNLPDLEGAKRVVIGLAAQADVFFLGMDEAEALFGCDEPGDALTAAESLGARRVVVKAGRSGCLFRSADGAPSWQSSFATEVIDTVGAGDAFAGGYLTAMLAGAGPDEAAVVASAMAARVLAHPGDHLPQGETLSLHGMLSEAAQTTRSTVPRHPE
ncbi:sugar kinase [Galbitalea sp. SE-J8]|uniref:sugar kinase n=1 Tax=Galbitalea sp. SE-J8 TaxID=3054952 RepID=UPI00259D1910|nr:sugar kinase [Galbitalea sp. SE-J8]MDM4762992.1 sugar kinase [Galbitalea sp. SE-J8]